MIFYPNININIKFWMVQLWTCILILILTNIEMSYYILLSHRLKDRFCPVPWILQHILVEIVLLALLVVLLMDLGNTARMQLEDKMGNGKVGSEGLVIVIYVQIIQINTIQINQRLLYLYIMKLYYAIIAKHSKYVSSTMIFFGVGFISYILPCF